MNLINNQNRGILSEGRICGMGFSFLKEVSENTLETLLPFSSCKDFLNDFVYKEITDKNIYCYGLSVTQKHNLLENEYFYLGMKILGTKYKSGPDSYPDYTKDFELLKNNRNQLLSFINQFEQRYGFTKYSEFLECENDPNCVIIVAPIEWMHDTYCISLYTLLLRVGLYYNYENINDYLISFMNSNSSDSYMLKNIYEKLKSLNYLSFFKISTKLKDITNNYTIHNRGIVQYFHDIKK
jgi:hypothetical protein